MPLLASRSSALPPDWSAVAEFRSPAAEPVALLLGVAEDPDVAVEEVDGPAAPVDAVELVDGVAGAVG